MAISNDSHMAYGKKSVHNLFSYRGHGQTHRHTHKPTPVKHSLLPRYRGENYAYEDVCAVVSSSSSLRGIVFDWYLNAFVTLI